jgi:hypothetical protein
MEEGYAGSIPNCLLCVTTVLVYRNRDSIWRRINTGSACMHRYYLVIIPFSEGSSAAPDVNFSHCVIDGNISKPCVLWNSIYSRSATHQKKENCLTRLRHAALFFKPIRRRIKIKMLMNVPNWQHWTQSHPTARVTLMTPFGHCRYTRTRGKIKMIWRILRMFRIYSTNGACGRQYMFSQILHLIPCIGVNGLGLLARFVAKISTFLSVLVPRMCVLYQNLYCIFSC